MRNDMAEKLPTLRRAAFVFFVGVIVVFDDDDDSNGARIDNIDIDDEEDDEDGRMRGDVVASVSIPVVDDDVDKVGNTGDGNIMARPVMAVIAIVIPLLSSPVSPISIRGISSLSLPLSLPSLLPLVS